MTLWSALHALIGRFEWQLEDPSDGGNASAQPLRSLDTGGGYV